MIIEISGVGFHNMGAELMLVAATDQLRTWDRVDDVAVGFRVGSRAQRRHVGCAAIVRLDSVRHPWANRIVTTGATLIPTRLLEAGGMYKPDRVAAVVDASGFAFGDQWGPEPSRRMARLFGAYARDGKPVVMLPQAFGPFQKPEVAAAARAALEHAVLIFARDAESRSHLSGLGLRGPVIEIAPDFTNLVEPVAERFESPTVIVIPNARMIDMEGKVAASEYLAFLRACMTAALAADCRVLVMAHEALDLEYASRLSAEFGDSVSLYQIDDAVRAKAMVGGATLVVSSRYHGLVNALSQCVPAIGTSWSHKYGQLFDDYACPDALWEVNDPASTERSLRLWLREAALAARRESLRAPAESLKKISRTMWSRVRELVTA